MTHRVFISYATGDEYGAREIYESLSRFQGIEVYIPEWADTEEKSKAHKIRDGLDRSDLVVVLITYNSTNTMWLNQEIGYAYASKIPIISLVEDGIDVRGYLEEENHVIFQRDDFKIYTYQTISKMRRIFSKTGSPVTHFRVNCPRCNSKYLQSLPPQEEIDRMIENRLAFPYRCNCCSGQIFVDPMTFATQSAS